MPHSNRRAFIRSTMAMGGACLLAGNGPEMLAQAQTTNWKKQMGIALYTVRDLMANDFEGTLEKLAKMGYNEVEPANGYNKLDAKGFRALLDRYGMTMPSTHTDYPSGSVAEIEKQLEAQQIMGIRYTEVRHPAPASNRPPSPRVPPGAYYNPGTGKINNSFKELGAFGPYQPHTTLEATMKRAAQLNADGKIAKKFGIKVFVHNHTGEFERLTDSARTEYEILLAETDPELVTMQLDIGWAFIAGMDPVELFKMNPGRYELWHIKDIFGLNTVDPKLSPNQRTASMAFAPVGAGQIDYKRVFGSANVAGLKHFVVEQDNAASWGDSLAAARISHENLKAIITSS